MESHQQRELADLRLRDQQDGRAGLYRLREHILRQAFRVAAQMPVGDVARSAEGALGGCGRARRRCHSEEPQATKNLVRRLFEKLQILRGVYPERSEWAQDDIGGAFFHSLLNFRNLPR